MGVQIPHKKCEKMKKQKHTKGPWLISTIDGEDCLMVGGGDGSEVVADIRLGRIDGLDTDGRVIAAGPNHDEAIANAHLIASAPELLEALRAVLDYHEEWKNDCGLFTYEEKKVRAAIAHAEGRDGEVEA